MYLYFEVKVPLPNRTLSEFKEKIKFWEVLDYRKILNTVSKKEMKLFFGIVLCLQGYFFVLLLLVIGAIKSSNPSLLV
jgi:hypothetical protein